MGQTTKPNFNTFEIVGSGFITTSTFAINGTAGQWNNSNNSGPDSVAHKLPFIPMVMGYVNISNQYTLMPTTYTQRISSTAMYFEYLNVMTDATNVYATDLVRSNGAISGVNGGGYTIKYFLLHDRAN